MGVRRRLVDLNRGSFNRAEAAIYELLSASAVRSIVSPILTEAVRRAPPGLVLDVGCGSGGLTDALRAGGHDVVGADPSTPQLQRLRRRGDTPCVIAPAGGLPFAPASFSAVISSCSVKHWPSLSDGVSECIRVLAPGGALAIVEIDGGQDDDELLRFAARARVPFGLRRAYRAMARGSFVPLTPDPVDVARCMTDAGLGEVGGTRIAALPFWVVTGRRPSVDSS